MPRNPPSAFGTWNKPWAARFGTILEGALSNASGCYTINSWCEQGGFYGGGEAGQKYYFGKKFSSSPPDAPLFSDGVWVDTWPRPYDAPPSTLRGSDGLVNNVSSMSRVCIDRHNMAVNVGFADGHVERVGLLALWGLHWNKHYSPIDILISYPEFELLLAR